MRTEAASVESQPNVLLEGFATPPPFLLKKNLYALHASNILVDSPV